MPEDMSALCVAEIGSFFVGGRMHRLQGLERIGTPGGPAYSINGNGEIMLGPESYLTGWASGGWPVSLMEWQLKPRAAFHPALRWSC